MTKSQHTRGFTLLELSIVLIIITAIVGAVLVGRTMIMASQLQTTMTDISNLTSAIGQFKQTYQALPGDMVGAATMWGTDSSGCPGGGGSTGTCDGDGNGKIGPVCSGGSIDFTNGNESFRVWQHLNAAGLYASTLSGVTAGGTYTLKSGINVPASPIQGGLYHVMWMDDPALCSNNFGLISGSGAYGNIIELVTGSTSGVMTPEDAESIDRKMDDGIPNTGKVRTPGTTVLPNCTLNPSGYTYNLTNKTLACALLFLTNY